MAQRVEVSWGPCDCCRCVVDLEHPTKLNNLKGLIMAHTDSKRTNERKARDAQRRGERKAKQWMAARAERALQLGSIR